jgi:hypothetical protein
VLKAYIVSNPSPSPSPNPNPNPIPDQVLKAYIVELSGMLDAALEQLGAVRDLI